jgi:hypothetical protein
MQADATKFSCLAISHAEDRMKWNQQTPEWELGHRQPTPAQMQVWRLLLAPATLEEELVVTRQRVPRQVQW